LNLITCGVDILLTNPAFAFVNFSVNRREARRCGTLLTAVPAVLRESHRAVVGKFG
jgi:hypothetical protein